MIFQFGSKTTENQPERMEWPNLNILRASINILKIQQITIVMFHPKRFKQGLEGVLRDPGFGRNKPFPSSLLPLFQNESKCETFHMKMGFTHKSIRMQIISRVQPTPPPPRHPPPWWIVVRCARNINKDGARFGVRVRLWRSYGKIGDCKQSIKIMSKTSLLGKTIGKPNPRGT